MNSLGSLASLGSLSLGLVCAATTASGTAIPFEPISRSVILDPVPHDEDRTRNTYNGLHAREPQAGERTDAVPSRGGPKKGDGRVDGSLPNGPERKVGDDTPGMKSPGMVITECSVPGTAALTFDDGPYLYTEEISRVLKENDAVGTFFVSGYIVINGSELSAKQSGLDGQNFGCINDPTNVERIKAAYDAGHQIASHSWSHKDLATLSPDEVVSELSSVTQAIQSIIGVTPAFMRPPYGSYNDATVDAAAQIGQDVVLWNLDSGDSVGAPPSESQSHYEQAVEKTLPILSLNHETHETTVREVLPAAIKTLKDGGYRLVSVAECLGKEAYLKDAPPLPKSDLNCS